LPSFQETSQQMLYWLCRCEPTFDFSQADMPSYPAWDLLQHTERESSTLATGEKHTYKLNGFAKRVTLDSASANQLKIRVGTKRNPKRATFICNGMQSHGCPGAQQLA
jgi:hypothetical protein